MIEAGEVFEYSDIIEKLIDTPISNLLYIDELEYDYPRDNN